MTVLQAHDVWVGHVGILVDLVRVVSRYATFSGEGEFSDDVDDLSLISCLLLAVS